MTDKSIFKIEKYAIYYGFADAKRLKDYDLVVLEPKAWDNAQINALKKEGKLVIAYLSLLEIRQDDELYDYLGSEQFLKHNGKTIINNEYNTYFMDISNPVTCKGLVEKAKNLLENGYDGLFIDTIGSIDYIDFGKDCNLKLMEATVSIYKQIKSCFGSALIIQNNGLWALADYTAEFIDGICFENPPSDSIKFIFGAYKRLQQLGKRHRIKIFVLEEKGSKHYNVIKATIIKFVSWLKGFLYYRAERYYSILTLH